MLEQRSYNAIFFGRRCNVSKTSL